MPEVDAYNGQGGILTGTCRVLVQVPVLEVDAYIGQGGIWTGTCDFPLRTHKIANI